MRIPLAIAALVLTPLLTSCVSTYVQPADSPNVAHITYLRDPGLPGLGNLQLLVLADSPRCERVQQLDSFSPLSSNFGRITERQVRLPGGAITHLVTLTVTSDVYLSRNCKNMVSFTPRAGGTYEVLQHVDAAGCRTTVTDTGTHASPPDLEIRPAIDRCTVNLE